MRILEIAHRLEALGIFTQYDVFIFLMSVYLRYAELSLQQMTIIHKDGQVDDDTFNAYCYLWRNMTARFGSDCISFQL